MMVISMTMSISPNASANDVVYENHIAVVVNDKWYKISYVDFNRSNIKDVEIIVDLKNGDTIKRNKITSYYVDKHVLWYLRTLPPVKSLVIE
jgi:hypothetical protein